MEKLRPVIDVINEVGEPYKSQIIKNIKTLRVIPEYIDSKTSKDIKGVLKEAFIWRYSEEGEKYWVDFYNSINNNTMKYTVKDNSYSKCLNDDTHPNSLKDYSNELTLLAAPFERTHISYGKTYKDLFIIGRDEVTGKIYLILHI